MYASGIGSNLREAKGENMHRIIQCEECGKQYKIDEQKISGPKVRFKCRNCGDTIEVYKQNLSEKSAQLQGDNKETTPKPQNIDWEIDDEEAAPPEKSPGLTISKKLLLLFVAFILVTGCILSVVYMTYVPSLMNDQINLRTFSISRSFSASIQQPYLINDFLLINKAAETNAGLPGVAYVSVINGKGQVVAGIFGDLKRFSADFVQKVEKNGFPKEISTRNKIPGKMQKSALDLSVGGQKIHDVAVKIGDTGGETHVGIFTEDVEKAILKSLIPLLLILGVIAILGFLSFLLVARTIASPIKALTLAAEKISLGEINLPIEIKGGGEIAELAASLERMRFSIKTAINRLRRN